MAVWLQTDDGMIKKYKTTYASGGGDSGSTRYHTKCGENWNCEPTSKEECSHLECAIYIEEEGLKLGWKVLSVLFLACAVVFAFMIGTYNIGAYIVVVGSYLFISFLFLIEGIRARKRFNELTEYRDRGTINGIKASQISYDHLECAIYSVRNWRLKEMAGHFLAVIAAIFLGITAIAEIQGIIRPVKYTFVIFICSIVPAIYYLSLGREEKRRLDELNEFKKNGTIKGVKASQIEAKAKHWWQF